MTLEAAIYPEDLFSYSCKDLHSIGEIWSHDFGLEEEENKASTLYSNCHFSSMVKEQCTNSSSENYTGGFPPTEASTTTSGNRRKRQRTKRCKNKEEVETQRMTHIAVERNRRKQMNDYLSVLRSLMPASYVQRGDQASIIGGAINYVKELEQLLQSLEAQKRIKQQSDGEFSSLFAEFFTLPQYTETNQSVGDNRSGIADIEVTMVENHANLKVLSRRRPKQLLKMLAGFQTLRLTILHLNVTTVDQMVLYSFSVKVEEECQLTTVDGIANAVYEILGRILEEASLNTEP